MIKVDNSGRFPTLLSYDAGDILYHFYETDTIHFSIAKVKATKAGQKGYVDFEPIEILYSWGKPSAGNSGCSWAASFFDSVNGATKRAIIHLFESEYINK